ncbi:acyl-CoA thioesterase II [Nocardioides panacihumi]|uniref:Acyl-CoA thioesterase II n=1 Tax=Nocardioides panacihumi TaxID=400774 RepID=A0ABN2QUX4_9ACTN
MTDHVVCPDIAPTSPVKSAESNAAEPNGPVSLADLVAVRPHRDEVFHGWCHAGAPGRVMGGQVAAQALAAAGATVDADRVAHSLHGYFLREGRPDRAIEYRVSTVRDGRSYSARHVAAVQDGAEIFVLTASFVRAGTGPERQLAAPAVPGPDTVPNVYDVWRSLHPEAHAQAVYVKAVEVRIAPLPTGPTAPDPDGAVHQDVWLRSRTPLPDDPLVQACALTYLSDVTLAQSSAIEHDVMYPLRRERGHVALASIDHALWFHRRLRADEWLHLRQTSSSTGAGRGFNTGTFWDPNGVMVASAAQESVVRLLPDSNHEK